MSGWWGFFERQQKSIKIAAILPESLMYSFFRVAFAQNKEYCWWPFPGFPWVVLLIMKSTIYSHIVDELRFCAFTESVFCVKLTQVLSCLTHRWVAFTHNVVYILLNNLKLPFTHYLVSLWMQRVTQFLGGSQIHFFGDLFVCWLIRTQITFMKVLVLRKGFEAYFSCTYTRHLSSV